MEDGTIVTILSLPTTIIAKLCREYPLLVESAKQSGASSLERMSEITCLVNERDDETAVRHVLIIGAKLVDDDERSAPLVFECQRPFASQECSNIPGRTTISNNGHCEIREVRVRAFGAREHEMRCHNTPLELHAAIEHRFR